MYLFPGDEACTDAASISNAASKNWQHVPLIRVHFSVIDKPDGPIGKHSFFAISRKYSHASVPAQGAATARFPVLYTVYLFVMQGTRYCRLDNSWA
jgi:hypothetical protein